MSNRSAVPFRSVPPGLGAAGALSLAAAAALLACGRSPSSSEGGGERPATPVITSAVLTAGAEGVLTGSHLDRVSGSLTVDGQTVAISVHTAAELRFTMPRPRPCEVAGRPVPVAAGTFSYTGALQVPGVLQMEVGESRTLPLASLPSACIQIGTGGEEYVVSALNASLDGSTGVTDTMLTLRALTAGAPAAADRHPDLPGDPAPAEVRSAALPTLESPLAYSASPAPFDPRYATAIAGDTVRWVDYRAPAALRAGFCDLQKESVPTYPVIVVATSPSGRVVIGVDARNPRLADWLAPAEREWLVQVADIADRVALAAAGEVFNRDHLPAAGAGGRWWHVFSAAAGGFTVDASGRPQSLCRWYSEVAATLGPDVPLSGPAQVPSVAAYLIHEYGHQAELVETVRRTGAFPDEPGWLAEAWAQTVQETAARIASGQSSGARFDALAPGAPMPDFYANAWGAQPAASPWRAASPYPRGAYEQGTRFLMFVRERWGDAKLGSARERLFQRLLGLHRYDVPALAELAGTDAVTLLDRWALAEATDDLLDPASAAAHGLPQLETWVPPGQGGGRAVPRTHDSEEVVAAGRGNYAALYLRARGADAGRGVSLTFADVRAGPYVLRITRLR